MIRRVEVLNIPLSDGGAVRVEGLEDLPPHLVLTLRVDEIGP